MIRIDLMKKKYQQYIRISNIFMNTENSKTSDPNVFRLYFTGKIDLKGNKKIALSDLLIHYTTLGITWYSLHFII